MFSSWLNTKYSTYGVTVGPGAGGGGGRVGGQTDQRRVQSPQPAALRRQTQAGDQVQQPSNSAKLTNMILMLQGLPGQLRRLHLTE